MNWPETTIGEIGEVKGGKRLPEGHEFSAEPTLFSYIRARDIGEGKIAIQEPVYLSEHTRRILNHYTVAKDNIVITIVGANVGDIGYISDEFDGANLTENAAKIAVNEAVVNPYFLRSFLLTKQSKSRLSFIASGAAQGKLGLYKIKSFTIPIPPLSIQKKIAAAVKNYDDLIENNLRRIRLLEEAARMLYREWFVHLRFPGHEHGKIIDGIPDGWERRTLGEIAKVNQESFGTKDLPDEIHYIDISSVARGRVIERNKMSAADAPGRARRKAKDGDIIWSNVRPNLRAYALVLDPGETDVFSTGFTVISARTIPFTWLYLFVTTDNFVGHLVNHATGVGYPAVRSDDFERAAAIVPPNLILATFHEATEPNFRLIANLERQNAKLAEARDLLLPRLMSGEIVL